jgi:tetratricopeptide (TPR) repeat protein
MVGARSDTVAVNAAAIAVALILAIGPAGRPAQAQGTGAEWPALLRRYEQQVGRAPSDVGARFALAMIYARTGRLLDGYQQLRDTDALVGAGGRGEMARQIVNDADALLRRNPQDLLARYRSAFARYFLGDRAGAVAEFERIVAVDAKNDWGYGYLGQAYAETGRPDRAIATWERGLQVNGQNAVLHYVLGLAYARANDKKKAAQHLAAAYRDRTLYEYVTGSRR